MLHKNKACLEVLDAGGQVFDGLFPRGGSGVGRVIGRAPPDGHQAGEGQLGAGQVLQDVLPRRLAAAVGGGSRLRLRQLF